jgi:ornithine cyclodeaminase/alanine dehydrogenase-like protein (mu-crystallin family)
MVPEEQLGDLKRAFGAYHGIVPPGRIHAELPHRRGKAVVLMPGLADGVPAYSVKVNAKFPDQRPAIKGAVLLHDLETGALLAVLDAAYVTAARTALAGALAADLLARPEAQTVAIIGAGVQGDLQLHYLSAVRRIARVLVYDVDAERVARFAAEHAKRLGVPVDIAADVPSAVSEADVIVTATWARTPFLSAAMLRTGAHITTLGADEPGKAEVDDTVIRQSVAVVDDRVLAVKEGMIAGAGLGPEAISAELGEIVRGDHPGRTRPDQTTIFGAVGLPMLDLVVSWGLYARAQHLDGLPRIDLLA